jgi:hypothetical protein
MGNRGYGFGAMGGGARAGSGGEIRRGGGIRAAF